MGEMAIFNVQRSITFELGNPVMFHVFCLSPHNFLHSCEFSRKYLKWYQSYGVDSNVKGTNGWRTDGGWGGGALKISASIT